MGLTRHDETELLTALHEGVREAPRWTTLRARLRGRLGADRVDLIDAAGEAIGWDGGRLGALRPGRVYARDELGGPPDGAWVRAMRVTAAEGHDAWLIAARAGRDFDAADAALIAALAPHLAIALGTLAALERAGRRAAISGDALARLGRGWATLDARGAVIDRGGAPIGEVSQPALRASIDALGAGRPIALPASPGEALLVAGDDRGDSEVAILHRAGVAPPGGSASALAALLGLTPAEARFALALARGHSLAEAAAAHDLTIETARNYSKRIYARTGARGQPDLVRRVLASAAMLVDDALPLSRPARSLG